MRTAIAALTLSTATIAHAENRMDLVRPNAPELAAFGAYKTGVTTLNFVHTDQVDVANTPEEGNIPTYNRSLTVEVWYPASEDTEPGGTYSAIMRDGASLATLTAPSARDASPAASGSFPLVIISHGYPGNRFLLAPLAENLASKGYVVAAIDHPDSTYDDQTAFGSTLVNRPWDQRFVIDQMTTLDTDLGAIVEADTVGVVGYSMGGYGALVYAGAGVTQASTEYSWGAPQGLLERNMSGTDTHATLDDDRVKAVVAFGPWGNNAGFWDADGLAGIDTPLMLIAGSVDTVSVYEAMRGIFDNTTNTTRHLLTFINAGHNAGAPMPAPVESFALPPMEAGWHPSEHYMDPVWDSTVMNNISQHFVTAYLDLHLKGDADKADYLDLVPDGAAAVWALDEDGTPTEAHDYWKGFKAETAVGLRFETKAAGE